LFYYKQFIFTSFFDKNETLNRKYYKLYFSFRYKRQVKHARLRDQPRPPLSYVSSGPAMISSGSHTTLGPGTMVTLGPHEGPYEWGADTTLYHPSTLGSRT